MRKKYLLLVLFFTISTILPASGSLPSFPDQERISSYFSNGEGPGCLTSSEFTYHDETARWDCLANNEGFTLSADEDGFFYFNPDESSLSFKIQGIGRNQYLLKPEPGEITISGYTIKSIHLGFTEWYVISGNEIEHGMDIKYAPPGEGKLIVAFKISGDFTPVITDNKDTVYFVDDNGLTYSYGDILAWDSSGNILNSGFNLSENTLYWEIDDSNAQYPVTIDPVMKYVETISASDGASNDQFGYSTDQSGLNAIIGAYKAGTGGQAYVFKNDGADNWNQVAILTASDASANDKFGYSSSISGNYAVAGAYSSDIPGKSDAGQAYIFKNDGADNWNQIAILNASNASVIGEFGSSVSINNNYILVGAKNATAGTNIGQAYIFKKDGADNWNQVAILNASDAATGDSFGYSAHLSGNYAIIGAGNADLPGKSNAGEAYIFKNDGADNWNQVAILNASDAAEEDIFGSSVSIDADTGYSIVGARNASDGRQYAGQAYIFRNDGADNWNQVAILNASTDSFQGDLFGSSVTLDGDYAVTGAYKVDIPELDENGRVYIFRNDGADNWNRIGTIQHPHLTAFDTTTVVKYFGIAASIEGTKLIIGAHAINAKGEAFIFDFENPLFTSIAPETGMNNNNSVPATIIGNYFFRQPEISVKLQNGAEEIPATGIEISTNNNQINCTFNICGATSGAWDVVITNADGSTTTSPGAFTITAVPEPDPTAVATSGGETSSGGGSNTDTGVGAAKNLNAGDTTSFNFEGKGAVYDLSVKVSEDTPSLMVTVKSQSYLPSSVNAPDTEIYEYEDVTTYHTDASDISGGTFEFRVSKSWVSAKGYTMADVVMLHYTNNEWMSLPTEFVREEGGYYYYTAETPSFSWFAIGIGEGETILPEATPKATQVETSVPAAETNMPVQTAANEPASLTDTPYLKQDDTILPVFLIIGVIIGVLVLAAVVWQIKQREEYPDWWDENQK